MRRRHGSGRDGCAECAAALPRACGCSTQVGPIDSTADVVRHRLAAARRRVTTRRLVAAVLDPGAAARQGACRSSATSPRGCCSRPTASSRPPDCGSPRCTPAASPRPGSMSSPTSAAASAPTRSPSPRSTSACSRSSATRSPPRSRPTTSRRSRPRASSSATPTTADLAGVGGVWLDPGPPRRTGAGSNDPADWSPVARLGVRPRPRPARPASSSVRASTATCIRRTTRGAVGLGRPRRRRARRSGSARSPDPGSAARRSSLGEHGIAELTAEEDCPDAEPARWDSTFSSRTAPSSGPA